MNATCTSDTVPKEQNGRSMLPLVTGISMVILSFLLWILLPLVHFIPRGHRIHIFIYAAILVLAELLFWGGGALAGHDIIRKIIEKILPFLHLHTREDKSAADCNDEKR